MLFSLKYSVPRRLLREGGVESVDFLFFSWPLPFVGVSVVFMPKLFLQLWHLQSLHVKPAVKHGHFVLFLPVTSTQETVCSTLSFFFFASPHRHCVNFFVNFFSSTLPQERHLHRSRSQAWPLLTQGQRDFPPLLKRAALFRDFCLLPQLHPVSLAGWHSGSCSSLDSSLLRTPRPQKSDFKYHGLTR